MASFEWLKIKEGKPKEIPTNSRNSQNLSVLFHKKRMHYICMLLDARMIVDLNLMAAKQPK